MELNAAVILARLDEYLSAGELAKGELLLRACLEQAEEQGRKGLQLTLLNELEGLLRTTGGAAEAVKASDRALALVAELGLEGTAQHATTLLNGATACRAAGESDRALELYRAAEAIYRSLGWENSCQMAALWNNLSQVYQVRGDHRTALDCLTRALPLLGERPELAPERATTLVNMSLSLLPLGRPEEAESLLGQAMEFYNGAGADDPHRGSALSALGELAYRRGERDRALSYLEEALQVTLERFGENDACRIIRENLAAVRENT